MKKLYKALKREWDDSPVLAIIVGLFVLSCIRVIIDGFYCA